MDARAVSGTCAAPVVIPDLEAVRHLLLEPSGGTSWDGYIVRVRLRGYNLDWWRFSGSERRFSGGTFRAVDLAQEALAVDLATSQRMEEV